MATESIFAQNLLANKIIFTRTLIRQNFFIQLYVKHLHIADLKNNVVIFTKSWRNEKETSLDF